MSKKTEIQEKVVIVTGASSGIGKATAELLVHKGYRVALVARRKEILEEMVADFRINTGFTNSALSLPADVTDPDQMKDVVSTIETIWGRVDGLVNNAGRGVDGPLCDVDLKLLREVMELNYIGAVNCIQAVVPAMRRSGGGTIVNVSSVLGRIPFPNFGGYVASKYALEGMDACLRMELMKDNIKVCLVRPAKTKTDFNKNVLMSGFHYERSGRGPASEPAENLARAIESILRTNRRFTTRTLYGKLLIAWRDLTPSWQEALMGRFLPSFTPSDFSQKS